MSKGFGGSMIVAAAAMLTATMPARAAFVVSIEAPKVVNSTSGFDYVGVQTFDSIATGSNQTFTSTSGPITATYSSATVTAADQYGGAGGNGRYVTTGSPYTINLSTTQAEGINYFGYWLSALNSGNVLTFYSGNTQVATYDAAALASAVGSNSQYNGNPATGANAGEKYAFLNFYDQNGTFDRVVVSGSGHESDNHTVGRYNAISGTVVAGSVPEPATWAAMILGFGMTGAAMRRRRARAFA